MNELLNQLIHKVGLEPAMAEKVLTFLKEHASELPKWLGEGGLEQAKSVLGGALGGLLGGKKP